MSTQEIAPEIVTETPLVVESAPQQQEAPQIVAEQEADQPQVSKKHAIDEVPEEEPSPKKLKKRITRSTINKFLKPRGMLDSSILTWKDWDEGPEWGDSVFYHCTVLVDVMGPDGTTTLIPANSKVPKVDWLLSKSSVVFYPDGKIASAVICPISIHQAQLKSIPPPEELLQTN